MNAWIEHLNSPLVLIAFMLFVFAGVITKIIPIKSDKLKYTVLILAFILALAGMVFGFFSQKEVLQKIPEAETKTATATKPLTKIKQITKGNNSSAVIEQVDLTHKNVEQSTQGENSPAIISGGDAAVINKNK